MTALRRELEQRRDEARARALVRVANRSFKKQPSGLDRVAQRLVSTAAAAEVRYVPAMVEAKDAVSVQIDAPPERIYDIVTDVAQMGRLSPECIGGRWLDGATGPAVGARFKGTNKRGFARWSTTNKVIEAEVGRAFSFETQQSGYRWTYRFEPDGAGTVVTESRAPFKDRPMVAKVFTKLLLGGEAGHEGELRDGMRATLDRVKAIAEAG
jgi:uncharacterized protein YndB with AHSA1/START domain